MGLEEQEVIGTVAAKDTVTDIINDAEILPQQPKTGNEMIKVGDLFNKKPQQP